MSEQMLSKSQVEFYRANGYVVVEGVLTSARIAALGVSPIARSRPLGR